MLIDRKEQNVRLKFTKDAITDILTDNEKNEAHILRIQFKKDVLENLEKSGIYL